jgi:hypothetical protein
MTIPDNATWETVSDSTDTYEYLNGRLRSNIDMTLAQFPREADISIDANILEKEKPQTGLNNFGDVNIGNPFANRLSVLFSEKEIQQIRQSGALELFEQRRDELQNLA